MPQFSTKRRVRHAATDMFDLVADVEKYPQFVPLCTAVVVKSRMQKDDITILVADMKIAYKIISETFTSRVSLDRPNLKILVEYLSGPFKRMQNRWSFHAAHDGTSDVEFFIEYEFKSRAFALLMGTVFDAAFRRFATAFEQRADEVYRHKTGA